MKFKDMNLANYIVDGLLSQNIETATEIQQITIPPIKSGADVIGLSQTGSGKTYAYAIPVLELIDLKAQGPQVLVVCPTRELAAQVTDEFRKLTSLTSNISVTPIFGGSSIDRQVAALKRGAKIVIGTPGRLMDHLRRKTLKLDNLKTIILDEADEMLNMGFKEDIETILKTTPASRQTVMFSATMPTEIIKITKQYMKNPVLIKSKNQEDPHANIKQYFINCKQTEKQEVFEKIYKTFNPWISIVFCNTKAMTEKLSDSLAKKGLPSVCLHGDMRQSERKRTMENFKKENGGGILVATDVAARGIDIKNVDIVVNYDFPNNEDYYVHRIGRTGRAGKDGVSLTLITNTEQLKDLKALTNRGASQVEEYKSLSTTQLLHSASKFNAKVGNTTNQRTKKPTSQNRRDGNKKSFGNNQKRSSKNNNNPMQKRARFAKQTKR